MFLSSPFGFLGGAGGVVAPLLGGSAYAAEPGNQPAMAGWRFNPDGKVDMLTGIGWNLGQQNWYTPTTAAVGSQYFVRATLISGNSPGNVGTWLALTASRSWLLGVTDGGFESCVLLIEISTGASDATVVTDGQYEIEVLSEP